MYGGVNFFHLVHEALVDVQASGGIDDEDVEHTTLRCFQSIASDIRRRIR